MTHNYGSSKIYPDAFVQRGNTTQFRFNIREVTKETEQGTETLHKYDYVEVHGEVTYKKLVDAMIRAKYDVNDEFNVRSKPTDDPDYVAFTEYVEASKGYAKRGIQAKGYAEPIATHYTNWDTPEVIDSYLVDQLDELYDILDTEITGYHDMDKSEKRDALKSSLGIETIQ